VLGSVKVLGSDFFDPTSDHRRLWRWYPFGPFFFTSPKLGTPCRTSLANTPQNRLFPDKGKLVFFFSFSPAGSRQTARGVLGCLFFGPRPWPGCPLFSLPLYNNGLFFCGLMWDTPPFLARGVPHPPPLLDPRGDIPFFYQPTRRPPLL